MDDPLLTELADRGGRIEVRETAVVDHLQEGPHPVEEAQDPVHLVGDVGQPLREHPVVDLEDRVERRQPRQQPTPLVDPPQRLHQEILRAHLDRVLAPDALPLDLEPTDRPAKQSVDRLASRQTPDLGVDDVSLAEEDLAAPAAIGGDDGDARLLVRGDRAQQIDQRHIADIAHEAVGPWRGRLGFRRAGRAIGRVRGELEALPFAALQERARPRHHLLHVDRLDHEVVRARLEASGLALQPGLGDQNHRRWKPVAGLLDQATERQPVRIGGTGNHQIGPVSEALQRFFVGAGEADGEARVPQAQIEDATNRLVLFDDQNRLRTPPLWPLRLHYKATLRSICVTRGFLFHQYKIPLAKC